MESQPSQSQNVRSLVKVEEAQRILSMSRGMIYKLMEAGELAYVKIGKSRRIPLGSINDLVQRNLVGASA